MLLLKGQRVVLKLLFAYLPYIVGMLVAISMLRTSGTFDVIINGNEIDVCFAMGS